MITGAKFSVQSLQFRRMNPAKEKKTMRHVWDILSRDDRPHKLLIETWGGKPDGYIKCFETDIQLGRYLSARIAKSAKGFPDADLDLRLVGEAEFAVGGDEFKLRSAMSTDKDENAQMRLGIKGIPDTWDEAACFDKTLSGLFDFDDPHVVTDTLTAAMAGRVKSTFKPAGSWVEQLMAINEFITAPDNSLSDVLSTGAVMEYPPMDRKRIAEVIQIADGLRDKMVTSAMTLPKEEEDEPFDDQSIEAVLESEYTRPESWGGWA